MERRSAQRCPVCQGPAIADDSYPEGTKCRRSTCIHNFAEEKCPRCGRQDLEHVEYKDKKYQLKCRDCLNSWSIDE